MIVFGITGGTGAGKSSASEEFRKQGVYVIDADLTARAVCEKGTDCLKELAEYFGSGILDDDGNLRRRVLGDIVFNDKSRLKVLNEITHRYINDAIKAELCAVETELAAIDGAVIIGSPVEELCEFIVSILADDAIRLERIMRRDNISLESARSRIAAQPDDEFYISRSSYVIYNNGSASELASQVKAILNKIGDCEIRNRSY